MNDNLKKIGKNYTWLCNQLKEFNTSPKDSLIVTYDGEGKIFYQKKEKRK